MAEDLPEYLILVPSKKKVFLVLIGCLVFVGIGLWLLSLGEGPAWICIILFGIGVLFMSLQIIPGCSYLELEKEGFTMCSLFRKHHYTWDEIACFGVTEIGHNKMVGFDFSEKYDRLKKTRKVSQVLAGFEGGLHDTFGLKAEELADLMTAFKIRDGS